MDIRQYLLNLPVVKTVSLPINALFWADNRLYEVTGTEKGYQKARQWRRGENTEVALAAESALAQRLPTLLEGRPLPMYASRNDLLKEGRPVSYVFPEEQNALDAAYLDTALCGAASGLYVRRHPQFPAFEVTNGLIVLRLYYFMRTTPGVDTQLANLKSRLEQSLTPHRDGPTYWRLLTSWSEAPYVVEQTIAMRPVDLGLIELAESKTQPHIQLPPEGL
jgi:hypothetical protein